MFAIGIMYVCSSTFEWPREGPLFKLGSNKSRGAKQGHYSSHLLGHYCSQACSRWTDMAPRQESISRRPKQMYSLSDTRLGMAWGGAIYSSRSRINAARPN